MLSREPTLTNRYGWFISMHQLLRYTWMSILKNLKILCVVQPHPHTPITLFYIVVFLITTFLLSIYRTKFPSLQTLLPQFWINRVCALQILMCLVSALSTTVSILHRSKVQTGILGTSDVPPFQVVYRPKEFQANTFLNPQFQCVLSLNSCLLQQVLYSTFCQFSFYPLTHFLPFDKRKT